MANVDPNTGLMGTYDTDNVYFNADGKQLNWLWCRCLFHF